MKIKTAWCFFEQSGTFKREFQKFGVTAFDVDIKNNFGETDIRADLFKEIRAEVRKEHAIFSKIEKDDLIFAFFPCTKFSARVPLNARGEGTQMKNWSLKEKLWYSIETVQEIAENYEVLCLLVEVCLRKGIRLVVENPYTQPHFLTSYLPIKPTLIDMDRTERGDDFKKPTQYFFINCEPEHNLIFENISKSTTKRIDKVTGDGERSRQEMRSMISPVYANRFIREFLFDAKKSAVNCEDLFSYATKQERGGAK